MTESSCRLDHAQIADSALYDSGEGFLDFRGEGEGAVGFLDEAGDFAAGEAAEGFGLAIAAEDDHFDFGANAAEGVVGGAPVHAGHAEVKEDDVDGLGVFAEDVDGVLAAGG